MVTAFMWTYMPQGPLRDVATLYCIGMLNDIYTYIIDTYVKHYANTSDTMENK